MQLEQIKNKGQRRLGTDDVFGQTLYPSGSAGKEKFRRVKFLEDEEERDSFYSCKQCGFAVDGHKVQSPGGTPEGNGNVRIVSSSPVVDVGFCPFCGSANNR